MLEELNRVGLVQIYNNEASSYDTKYQDEIHATEDSIILDFIEPRRFDGARILDAGCGTGNFIKMAEIHPDDYFGIDISQGMLDVAQREHPDYSFAKKDIRDVSFAPFDMVIAIFGQLNYLGLETFVSKLPSRMRFVAVVYTGKSHQDYDYTKKFQTAYSATDIYKAFEGREITVHGLSFDCAADYQTQSEMTESGSCFNCKYLVVASND